MERSKKPANLFWFRRDLRLEDNTGLAEALKNGLPVLPIFIFDTNILNKLTSRQDARVSFIHQELQKLQTKIKCQGGTLHVCHGTPMAIFRELLTTYDIRAVFTNHDYEPHAIQRDQQIQDLLKDQGIHFKTFKDQVIFDRDDILKADGTPYTVFTPYMKRWKATYSSTCTKAADSKQSRNYLDCPEVSIPSLAELGFTQNTQSFPSNQVNLQILHRYHIQRDIPGICGTTKIGVHLRFGTISIRALVKAALESNEVYVNELIWREFYMMILWHFPRVVDHAFKPAYDRIPWQNDPKDFDLWCKGKTGYPLVDAGMRELNHTGYMHNRVRMLTASFLTKHLLIDWRWGEAYFAEKLLDFELASNNGGWQWAAGTGCDAAPYFRVFNPTLQAKKFDPNLDYIKKWVPELNLPLYPAPMVSHHFARTRAIETYKQAVTLA